MNIRIIALGLTLAAQTGFAQESYKPAKARVAERAAMLETLQKGKQIRGSRGQYRCHGHAFEGHSRVRDQDANAQWPVCSRKNAVLDAHTH